MKFGKLDFLPIEDNLGLVGKKVAEAIKVNKYIDVFAAAIDPELADTAGFCEHYGIGLDVSANCVVVEAKRGERVWYAACLVLATTRADINGIVRKQLDAKKLSFAPMDKAVALSQMEYGGITPIGLPADWPVLVDENVAKVERAVIGSGIRGSKLLVTGKLLASLPNSTIMKLTKEPID
jgi:prolyl-tRNA editing enzyme YbaK/EbsC (Cys-tRNA(Pro) deacylase)